MKRFRSFTVTSSRLNLLYHPALAVAVFYENLEGTVREKKFAVKTAIMRQTAVGILMFRPKRSQRYEVNLPHSTQRIAPI